MTEAKKSAEEEKAAVKAEETDVEETALEAEEVDESTASDAEDVSDDEEADDPGRRKAIIALGGVGALWAGGSLYPVYRYLAPREEEDPFKDGKVAVEKVDASAVKAPGMGKNGGYAGRGLIIYRAEDGSLRAFDSKCTHAGCNVTYEGDKFHCYCHGGEYNLDGINVSGPPPAPLTELRAFEEDGVLYVARIDDKKEG